MVYIYGASGQGKMVLEILKANNFSEFVFVDDRSMDHFMTYPVKPFHAVSHGFAASWIVAIGDNTVREQIASKINGTFINAIHPNCQLSISADLGIGLVLMPGSVINADVVVGNHVIINTKSSVDHDCIIGDFVHMAPGSTLCGNVSVGDRTLVGAGATVIPGCKIGRNCIIGAGAVVVNDIPDGSMVLGIPGRIVKRIEFNG